MSIYRELKRRNVIKVAAAYIIVGWLIMQIGEVMAPALHLPGWINSALAFFVILGFPLAMIFAWAFELTPDGLKLQTEVDREQSITHITGRRLDFWIIGLLAVALAFFAFDRFVLEPQRVAAKVEAAIQEAGEAQPAAAEPLDAPAGKSIAVLPFVNMSNDPDQEFFSDGISEELLNVLARYPGLRVAARTSSFQFKGQNLDIADIARQLRVSHVLEGSVRKAGDRIRITAQLIEADNGYHMWSDTFDRELTDVFAIQDEISAAIGEALKVTLALDNDDAAASPRVAATSSTAAYEAYMAGRQLINKRGRANVERAKVILEEAVKQDPDYAPAHAQLAIAYLMLSNTGGTYGDVPFPETKARALPHIERALALDENLAEAHGALTLMATSAQDHHAALEHAGHALQINPSYVDAINWSYLGYSNLARYGEAFATLQRLLEIDPLNVVGRSNMSVYLATRGELEAGISLANSIAEQYPGGTYLARGMIAHDNQGDVAATVDWFLRSYGLSPGDSFANGFLAFSFGHAGLMQEALRMREDTWYWAFRANQDWPNTTERARARLSDDPDNTDFQIYLAETLLFAGEVDEAREYYKQALAASDGRAILDPAWGTSIPTLHAAHLRRESGDATGALELMDLARHELRERELARLLDSWYYRSLAVLGAMEGNDTAAMLNLERAIDAGHLELSLFAEPALARLVTDPVFRDLEERMREDLAVQREAVLQLICFNNPVPGQWRPLPETCAGVEPAS